jgi:hypothetical protein
MVRRVKRRPRRNVAFGDERWKELLSQPCIWPWTWQTLFASVPPPDEVETLLAGAADFWKLPVPKNWTYPSWQKRHDSPAVVDSGTTPDAELSEESNLVGGRNV